MEELRSCSRCGQVKPPAMFYLLGDGSAARHRWCKACQIAERTERRANDRDKARAEYRAAHVRNREKRLSDMREYYQRRKHQANARRAERYALQMRARSAVWYAMSTGRLARPSECECCLEARSVEAHHEDYTKPLEVVWLCRQCHGKKHRKAVAA